MGITFNGLYQQNHCLTTCFPFFAKHQKKLVYVKLSLEAKNDLIIKKR